ncbi:MBOAT family protein [bacterium]|nr:MBOAT family protein [bacterium]
MLFNSIDFVVFLPVVLVLFYLLPHKLRWIFMLAASYYFYMCWKASYIILIIASTLIDYLAALQIEKSKAKSRKRLYLALSLFSNLGLLFVFKYYNFAIDSLNYLFEHLDVAKQIPLHQLLLPVGISFYTFQTLSYTIDVYYGRQKAEKHLGYFALYVSYFPQLVAGPIERFSRLNAQLRAKVQLNYENIANGLRLILFGFFIKMVVADNLSEFVEQVYAQPQAYSGLDVALGMVLYSFQIYGDFHGYSSIAIGTAMLFGVNLMNNFNTPYLSVNIKEFWSRWHISLSTWFRDYLYIPLGGNKVKIARWIINILIVFTVSGLWHGANWTFVIWGGLYGLVYIVEHFVNKAFHLAPCRNELSPKRLLLAIKNFVVVTLIWVFFRSQNLEEAHGMFSGLLNQHSEASLQLPTSVWVWFLLFIGSEFLLFNKRFDTWIATKMPWLRWAVYALLLFAILAFAGVQEYPFIYFQF